MPETDKPGRTSLWRLSTFGSPELVGSPQIADCTLREGDQCAGVNLTPDIKVEVAAILAHVGVHEIEIGMPAISEREQEGARRIVRDLGDKTRLTALCRARKEDLELAAEIGVWGVVLSLPAGELQIRHKLSWDPERVIATAVEMGQYAKTLGLHVTLSPYDTTRARPDFLGRYVRSVDSASAADRIRLVDTVGCATPSVMRQVMEVLASATDLPIEVHCHNDFGLALANTLEAIHSGAAIASSSFLGVGERAGNASTEEVAIALRVLYDEDVGINYSELHSAGTRIAELLGLRVWPLKPVLGENVFTQVSGMVVDGFLKDPFVAVPYLPEVVGRTSKITLGKGTGRSMVAWKLNELGMEADPSIVDTLTRHVKDLAQSESGTVSDEEFKSLATELIGRA